MLTEGQAAPDFTLQDDEGKEVKLSDFKGKNVILYFYPKDNTPGCTTEACNFRDDFPKFNNIDAVILGLSKDSVNSHKKFKEKYNLPFQLLSDPEGEVISKYGAWKEKTMFGKTSMGIERSTFVIDKEGVLRKVFRKVKVDGHNQEVLETVKALG